MFANRLPSLLTARADCGRTRARSHGHFDTVFGLLEENGVTDRKREIGSA
jgi:hypothetical protein